MNRPKTMRGIIFPEKGKAILQEEPAPELKPGHLLCQSLFSGLTNGTERNVLMGGNYSSPWPCRLGYQNVGRVIAVGEGIEGWKEGDILYNGDCVHHVEYFNANPNTLTFKLPAEADLTHAALFGMASVAVHDVRRAEVCLGQRILVIGAGLIGQFTAQAARAAGAEVTICDLDEKRLETARSLGAHHSVCIRTDEQWVILGQDGKFDVVFEDSGAPVLNQMIGSAWGQNGVIKHTGKLVLIAGRGEVSYNFNAGQRCELTVLHAGHFSRDDLRLLGWLVQTGVIRIHPLIQDVVKIDDAPKVYDKLRDHPASLFGTVFDWN